MTGYELWQLEKYGDLLTPAEINEEPVNELEKYFNTESELINLQNELYA